MDTAREVLREKFVMIQACLKRQEKSQINNLTLHLKELEKTEQSKFKVSRRKKIIKIRVEINETEIKKRKKKEREGDNNETKSYYLKR